MSDATIYVLETTSRLGVKEPIRDVFSTPHSAYERMVEHAGQEPPDGEPEWPDWFGDEMWGWKPDDGSVGYVIAEYVWSGQVDEPDPAFEKMPEGV